MRFTSTLIGAVLAASPLALPSVLAPSPTAPTTRATDVPCPRVNVKPPVKPSPMPKRDPALPKAVGGPALATKGLIVPPGAPPIPKNLSAKYWLVADLNTGAVLGACGPHEYGAPASTQKLLLALTALPKLNPKDVITVTAEDLDFEPGSSAVGLLRGGKYSVETLWLGLLLESGNDAANVLARVAGGERGVRGTLDAMNAEARRIGAFDTHAETPSGLDGPGQVTSVYDLALIARALFAREDFCRYVATRTAQIPPQPPRDKDGFQIQNDNRLLYEYKGALGGKTGFTDIARHTYVGAAERNGRRLVVTILGAEHQPIVTWRQGAALLDWGFSLPRDARVGRLVEPHEAPALLAAATQTPTPDHSTTPVAGNAPRYPTTGVLVGVASAGAAFVVVWLFVMIATRRRHARDRTPGRLP